MNTTSIRLPIMAKAEKLATQILNDIDEVLIGAPAYQRDAIFEKVISALAASYGLDLIQRGYLLPDTDSALAHIFSQALHCVHDQAPEAAMYATGC